MSKLHWERVYETKADEKLSWLQLQAATSLRLIERFAPVSGACGVRRVVDIGAGQSPLAGELVARGGYEVMVVDVAAAALERARKRLGESAGAESVTFVEWDVTEAREIGPVDVWHDRAVFHFLVEEAERAAYVRNAERAVARGGVVVMGTFALDGPERCSDLPVMRYDGEGLARAMGAGFHLVHTEREMHRTPWGKEQAFTWVVMGRGGRGSRVSGLGSSWRAGG